ncbi:MAG: sensor domain-containing diguanylate cyclase [Ilumatobacteraceae bacterium]
MARRLSTPVHELAAAAREVAAGNLDVNQMPLHGPREIVEVINAFNDMTATLTAVEAASVALADDHASSTPITALPGRTGRALQAALDRLSGSIAEAEQHRARLDLLATHDELTGLLNRRAALEAVDRDLHRARRDGTAVGVLFIDLDGLKTINDEYGHAAGDDALRQCAAALRDGARSADVPARLGGDEFVISAIVDRGDRDSLTALAERVRERVSSQVIAVGDQWVPLRCSVGVALCDDASTDAGGLIGAADTALYQAKTTGRNRVSW